MIFDCFVVWQNKPENWSITCKWVTKVPYLRLNLMMMKIKISVDNYFGAKCWGWQQQQQSQLCIHVQFLRKKRMMHWFSWQEPDAKYGILWSKVIKTIAQERKKKINFHMASRHPGSDLILRLENKFKDFRSFFFWAHELNSKFKWLIFCGTIPTGKTVLPW